MARAPFDNSRVKIDRSRMHIEELGAVIKSSSGAWLVPEQAEPELIALTVRIKHQPNDANEAILGDVVHNLRSALDLAAVTCVQLNGGNPKGVYFPFADSEGELENQIKRKNFHRASAEAVQLVRNLRPYKGGNVALRALHDLNVLDKHNDLIPTFALGVQQQEARFGTADLSGNSFRLQDGLRPITVKGTGAAVMQPIPLHLVAMFSEGQPFAGQEIVPTLSR